jgi:hypothetical protein
MHYKLFEMKIVEENTKFLEILATCLGRVLDSPLSVGTLKSFQIFYFYNGRTHQYQTKPNIVGQSVMTCKKI